MVPFIGQGGCMAIEDAYTFGLLFSKLEDLKEVFFLYEKLRLKRGNWMQARSRLQARFNHLSNPILVELRKLFIGAISQKAIKSIHSYDAHKEVMKQITG
jgi:2-polyprenyl-6-methoxyphenol hydroxylase-like FAD-dependent oxidoreductase